MGKYEKRLHFERLCELRDEYPGTTHEATDLTIDATIAYAATLLDDPALLDAILGTNREDSAPSTRDVA